MTLTETWEKRGNGKRNENVLLFTALHRTLIQGHSTASRATNKGSKFTLFHLLRAKRFATVKEEENTSGFHADEGKESIFRVFLLLGVGFVFLFLFPTDHDFLSLRKNGINPCAL